jgi:tetratricopeptide (TPR) repeat protein
LLCNSQFLKSEYIKKIESLPKQERLNEAADMYCVLGDIENATGDIESAKDAYSEAESRYKETDNLGLGRVWYGRGELNRKLNRWDKAETAYSQATDYYERANSRQGRAAVQLALGHIKRSTDDPVLTR